MASRDHERDSGHWPRSAVDDDGGRRDWTVMFLATETGTSSCGQPYIMGALAPKITRQMGPFWPVTRAH